ncbi:MAG: 5-formyltetrahydrofolate cyclo-ligase [Rickettsiales bacterium]
MTLPDHAANVAKRKLRQQAQQRRMAVPHAACLSASQSVARHFADHPILAFAPSFAGYLAMRGELDVRPVFSIMARFSKQTSLPCIIEQKTLLFRQWAPGDPLARHPLGPEEPLPTAPALFPEIILVPLLAFDGGGGRLGYGGGYYDRTMEAMRRFETPPLFVGVGYSMQEIDLVPMDAHDQPLDGVLTELGVSIFKLS